MLQCLTAETHFMENRLKEHKAEDIYSSDSQTWSGMLLNVNHDSTSQHLETLNFSEAPAEGFE